jgi:flagellar hook-associated protein 1 FlgK
MASLFASINTALRAVLAHQQVIQVIEHNVANANTPGYRRQEAVLSPSVPYPAPSIYGGTVPGQIGTGVTVDRIRRFNMEFFDGRWRRELGEAKRWELQRDVLQQVEATLAETSDDGIVAKLDAFWAGWQALSDDPTNLTLRANLREQAIGLAEAFNWRARSLMALQKDQDSAITQRVDEINSLASQIARLNVEITNVRAAGDQPNDLLDERDRAMDRLAELAGANVNIEENGEAIVSIGGHTLVMGSTSFTLSAAPDPNPPHLVQIEWDIDGRPLNVERGELYGILDARDRVIPEHLQALDTVARELVTQVNALHFNGYGLNNATHHSFFTPFTSNDYALEISVSADLNDLANIAASTTANSPGNADLAVAFAEFRSQPFLSSGTASLNQFYTRHIGELGLELRSAAAKTKDREVVVQSLQTLRESVEGVSLDEEAANLVKAQRSYQAAARLMTTVDEMLDTIINGMGLVGR